MPIACLAKPKPMAKSRFKKYPALTKEQQALVAEHKWIAGRLAHGAKCLTGGHTGSLTREDLESIANFALCVAATRYNSGMNVKYSTYAWNTARGYLQHALRDYSRMVRTPRWVATYKDKVLELLAEGKTYQQVAKMLDISDSKALVCELSVNNYHISYDSRPDDWSTPEFVYEFDEAKASLLSKELTREIRELTDAEMAILLKYTDQAEMSKEEQEWAAEKFHHLWNIAHGNPV